MPSLFCVAYVVFVAGKGSEVAPVVVAIIPYDALPFPGSLGASGIGTAGPAGLEVAAVEEAEVPVLVFPVCLMEVYKGKTETGEAREECVFLGDWLTEALLVFLATAAI